MRALASITVIVLLTAACGAAVGSHSSGPTRPAGSPPGTIAGVFRRGPANTSGRGVAGIRIGLFVRPIILGPVMQDPPRPVRVTVTGAGGRFRFSGLSGRRYFVAPVQPAGYAPGRWALPGGAAVVIRACTTCVLPM